MHVVAPSLHSRCVQGQDNSADESAGASWGRSSLETFEGKQVVMDYAMQMGLGYVRLCLSGNFARSYDGTRWVYTVHGAIFDGDDTPAGARSRPPRTP
ncbi:MAG: hypothetical protein NVS2B7_27290 [Herpetosiphon sp.]